MTPRGWTLALLSAGLIAMGWQSHWPELTALGAAGLAAVVAILIGLASRPRGTLTVDQGSMRVVRTHPASVRVGLSGSHRGALGVRLVEGDPRQPSGSMPISRHQLSNSATLRFPLDTSRRGQRPIGPFTLLQGDPWGVVSRVVDHTEGGLITVHPRVFPVRRSLAAHRIVSDSETADRRLGDMHFHALRDYVMGDEPRMVHWRSSARAGHLVVRQNLAATASGTTVVIDTDVSAYGSDQQFGQRWLPERFENAIEVIASIVASLPKSSGQVHLTTTAAGSAVTSSAPGAINGLLDRLAVVDSSPPLEVVAEQMVSLVRSTRCSRLIVVTGTPSRTLVRAVAAAGRVVPGALVFRVGSTQRTPLELLRVVDIDSVEELV